RARREPRGAFAQVRTRRIVQRVVLRDPTRVIDEFARAFRAALLASPQAQAIECPERSKQGVRHRPRVRAERPRDRRDFSPTDAEPYRGEHQPHLFNSAESPPPPSTMRTASDPTAPYGYAGRRSRTPRG